MGKGLRAFLFFSLLVFSAASTAFSQGTTSRVVGTVADPSGAVIGGARVTLTSEQTGAVFQTETGAAGAWQVEAVQAGTYTVAVESAGFKKFVTKGNQVSVGAPATVNVVLEVGSVTDQIQVEAVAEQVQLSQSGNVGPVISERMMKEMPIVATRRRDPTSILNYVPGMNSGGNTGGGGHMNGARDRAWNFTLDGIDMNEVSAGGGVGNNPIRVNPDSVAEMRIVTSNASAEFGRNSGAQVAMVTKSGGNDIHGNLFWFYRTPRFNANQWEDNLNRIGKQNFIQNIYGGSLGGPIKRNKLFYFANWQELRAARSISQTATVLTQEARNGVFRFNPAAQNRPAGVAGAAVSTTGAPLVPVQSYNVVQQDPDRRGLDGAVRTFIGQTPLPNRFEVGDGLNYAGYVFRPTETEEQRDLTGKIDYIINGNNTVFARLYWGYQNTLCDGVNGGLPRVPGAPCLTDTKRSPRNYAFNWRSNPRPAITNELVAGWSEFFFDFPNPVRDLRTPTLVAPLGITVPTATTYGNARQLKTLQFVDNLSYFAGKHAFKGGVNVRYVQHLDTRGSIGGQNAALVVNFDRTINTVSPAAFGLPAAINQNVDRPALESMINLLLGRVGTIAQGFVADGNKFRTGTFDFDSRFYEYDFYFQDTWKVSKRLTVDLGLRLEARKAPFSAGSQPILTPGTVVAAGAAPSNTLRWSEGKLYRNDYNNLGPSLGIAWDPTGSGKSAVRANYRLAYDRIPTFLLSSFLFPSMPGSVLGEVNSAYGSGGGRLNGLPSLAPVRTPQELAQPVPFSLASNTVVDPNLETPQTNMWSLGVQREIAPRTVVEVNYLGRRAHNLFGGYNVNQAEIRSNGFLEAFRTAKAGGESVLLNNLTRADSRRLATESGAAFLRRQFTGDLNLNNVAGLASQLAQRNQGGTSLSNASGLGPYFFFPYPQYSGGLNVIDSNDFSTYHSLQLSIDRRFKGGANIQAFYTWSKSLDTRSYDPTFTLAGGGSTQTAANTPFDINNRRLNYGISDFDRRHQLQMIGVQELPFGRGKLIGGGVNGVVDRIIGGWNLSGLFRATSGRPFSVFAGSSTFNSFVGSFANCTGCSRSDGAVREEDGLIWYFNPAERGRFSAPGIGELGNTGRNFFRGDRFVNLDFSIAKKTRISERMNLEIRADFVNFTNSPSFGFPTATITSATFGRIRDSVISTSRQTMVAAKLNF
ncbi:MAG: carboxypeptidase regulatory-like domain-containing protein [Acidobacteria bacterium]|nr:carboxypeptidase regulatory-like domain-containing protein [Acidobacteriota bacterium]